MSLVAKKSAGNGARGGYGPLDERRKVGCVMGDLFDSPVLANDLRAGERWFSPDHGGSTQDLGHDLTVRRYTGSGNWTCIKSGTDGSKNGHSLAWMKPVYAMRDGVVERSWRNAPDNPAPSQKHPNIGIDPGDIPSGGNHVLVRYDDGSLMLYAHFAKGTLAQELCPETAELIQPGQSKGFVFDPAARPSIKHGQFLGRVGNSGQSTGPHLHIHRVDENHKALPLPLERGMVTTFSTKGCSGKANINKWTRLQGSPIPQSNMLFWPPRRLVGEYTRHAFPAGDFQRMFSHLADSGFWPEWINGYSVGGKVFFNFVWRPALDAWRAHFGLTQAKLRTVVKDAEEDGYGAVHLDSYLQAGRVRYIVIFRKESPAWRLRSNRTPAQHQAIFEQMKKDGFSPVSVSVVSLNGDRRYSVLYGKVPGQWSLNSIIKETDYQEVFEQNRAAGRIPVYLKAYMHNGTPTVSGIFSTKPSGAFRARHKLSASGLQSEFNEALHDGFGTEVITAFDGAKSKHRFFAVWRK